MPEEPNDSKDDVDADEDVDDVEDNVGEMPEYWLVAIIIRLPPPPPLPGIRLLLVLPRVSSRKSDLLPVLRFNWC